MRKLIALAAATLLLSLSTFADIPRPDGGTNNRVKKPIVVDTTLDISLDAQAKEARLIIPASRIKELRAELEELEALDNGEDNTAALGGTSSFTKVQTIVAGTLMSLAFVFGGLWLSRNRRIVLNSRAVGIVAVASILGAGATLLYANAGPPAEARSITGKMFSQSVHIYGFGYGRIKLEAGTGDRVRLIVPNPKDEKPAEE
jgi:hypothetical protein